MVTLHGDSKFLPGNREREVIYIYYYIILYYIILYYIIYTDSKSL